MKLLYIGLTLYQTPSILKTPIYQNTLLSLTWPMVPILCVTTYKEPLKTGILSREDICYYPKIVLLKEGAWGRGVVIVCTNSYIRWDMWNMDYNLSRSENKGVLSASFDTSGKQWVCFFRAVGVYRNYPVLPAVEMT